MKTKPLSNYHASVGVEVYDVDLNNPEELLELGKLAADQCIVVWNTNIPTEKLYEIQSQWGSPARAIIHNYVLGKKIQGRHWRELFVNMGYISKEIDPKMSSAVVQVSYLRDEQNRPKGLFAQGELDWHCDQVSIDDAPRMIGLQSVSDTENSQTQFLCTYDAWETLSSEIKSTVKELVMIHRWREGYEGLAPGLDHAQTMIAKYNNVPLDGLETKVYTETATGRPGMKLSIHGFDGFVGMGMEESRKLFMHLWNTVMQEKYVYTQNWQDGQIVFMDQEITLHKRPTNIQHGNKRKMARVTTFLDKLYPQHQPREYVRFKGKNVPHDEFAKLVDEDRQKSYQLEQHE